MVNLFSLLPIKNLLCPFMHVGYVFALSIAVAHSAGRSPRSTVRLPLLQDVLAFSMTIILLARDFQNCFLRMTADLGR